MALMLMGLPSATVFLKEIIDLLSVSKTFANSPLTNPCNKQNKGNYKLLWVHEFFFEYKPNLILWEKQMMASININFVFLLYHK